MSRLLIAVPAVVGACVFGACVSSPEVPAPRAFDFEYRLPAEPEVTYVRSDSSELRIDTPMGEMEMVLTSTATIGTRFASVPGADAIRVRMTLTALDAEISNTIAPEASIDENQTEGYLAFLLGSRGETEFLESEEIDETEGNFLNGEEIHLYFPRLPESAPAVGMSWTDTISYESALAGTGVRTSSRITYTLTSMEAGPGGNLLEIRAEGPSQTTMVGEAREMAIVGNFQGTQSGTLFLDSETSILVSADWTRTLSGETEVQGAANPGVGITQESHLTIRREETVFPAEVVQP